MISAFHDGTSQRKTSSLRLELRIKIGIEMWAWSLTEQILFTCDAPDSNATTHDLLMFFNSFDGISPGHPDLGVSVSQTFVQNSVQILAASFPSSTAPSVPQNSSLCLFCFLTLLSNSTSISMSMCTLLSQTVSVYLLLRISRATSRSDSLFISLQLHLSLYSLSLGTTVSLARPVL